MAAGIRGFRKTSETKMIQPGRKHFGFRKEKILSLNSQRDRGIMKHSIAMVPFL
ncbi:MAG: hypothetical protein MZV64_25485 [Ignavibacteriales bacterium]|nr:hypothetical protein [Ignavibacteriales bacterium]